MAKRTSTYLSDRTVDIIDSARGDVGSLSGEVNRMIDRYSEVIRRHRHVEQQFAQMRTTLHTAQVLLNGFAPARAQGTAHHALHGSGGCRTLAVRRAVHGNGNVMDQQLGIHGQSDGQMVDGLARLPHTLLLQIEHQAFGVFHFTFDVPQAIVAAIALKTHLAGMFWGAGLR